jgi:hypothetical protein
MNCVNHPDKEAFGHCTYCGRFFCNDCLVDVKGKMVCKDDVSKVLDEATIGVIKETQMASDIEVLKNAAMRNQQSPIVINNSASSSAAASAAAAAGGGGYHQRRMHWLYFFLIGWWLGLGLICCIFPIFVPGLLEKAFGYW